MSLNIIDLIKGQLGSALISQAASEFGESESGVSKAINGLLPAVIGGLANNADKPGIPDLITGAASGGILGNLLWGTANNSFIRTFLPLIFGDKIGGLVNAVSAFSGVSSTSSYSLLNMVTGAVLGSVGKYAADNNLDNSGITKLLEEQKGIVSTLLPTGLSLASLDLGNWFGETEERIKVTSFDEPKSKIKKTEKTQNNENSGSIWKWLLPILLIALSAWFLWKEYNKHYAPANNTTTEINVK